MLRSVHLYRPQRTQPEVLERTFVAREPLLEEILDRLRKWRPGASRQHHLLIGPRGIGKTNLLQLAAHRIRTEADLEKRWVPIVLPEDFYSLSKVSDLLLESLRLLGEETSDNDVTRAFSENRYDEDDARVSDRCLDAFRRFHRDHGRGVVLMIENVDRLLERQAKRRLEAHRLRRILIEEDWLVALCTSPTYLDAVSNPDEPFFEFFDVRSLAELSPEEQEEMLRRLAAEDQSAGFDEYLERFRSRLRALYHFTGGNPRLTVMLYDLLAHQKVGRVRNELDLLLDQLTPFYQDRMKEISEREAKVLETMALMPEGCTPTELAREARLDRASVRNTFSRLERAGYLRREERRRKQTIYVIPERFFRIWHQMNHSRAARGQIRYLLEFFSHWYASREERDRVWEELTEALSAGTEIGDDERAADVAEYMDYIVAASKGTERYQRLFEHLRQRIEAGLVRSIEDEISLLDQAHSEDADYHMQKGYCLATELELPELATEAFEEAIRLSGGKLASYFNYGVSQARRGNFKKASESLRKVADLLSPQEDDRDRDLGQALARILASSKDRKKVQLASYLLGALANETSATQVASCFSDDSEQWRRRYCLNTLGYLGDSVAIPCLIGYLRDSAAKVRGSAATALGRISDTAAVSALIDALQDSDAINRGSVATALGRISDTAAVPALVDALQDSASNVRGSVATALGRISDLVALPALVDALQDSASNVRGSAATALGRISDSAALPALVDALQDLAPNVRGSAATALGRLSDSAALPALIEAVQDSDAINRGSAATALGRISDTAAVPALIEALQDSAAEVRGSAATALGRISDTAAVPALIEALQDSASNVRGSAATALGRIPDTAAVPALIEALQDSASNVRGSAATALGRISDTAAVPTLIEALQDSASNVRGSAAIALGRIGQPESVPHLARVLHDSVNSVRLHAAVALGRLTAHFSSRDFRQVIQVLADGLGSSAALELGDFLDVFFLDVFRTGSLEPIQAGIEAVSDIPSIWHSAAWAPYRIAFEYLQADRDRTLLERQQPEMREAVMLLVDQFDDSSAQL